MEFHITTVTLRGVQPRAKGSSFGWLICTKPVHYPPLGPRPTHETEANGTEEPTHTHLRGTPLLWQSDTHTHARAHVRETPRSTHHGTPLSWQSDTHTRARTRAWDTTKHTHTHNTRTTRGAPSRTQLVACTTEHNHTLACTHAGRPVAWRRERRRGSQTVHGAEPDGARGSRWDSLIVSVAGQGGHPFSSSLSCALSSHRCYHNLLNL